MEQTKITILQLLYEYRKKFLFNDTLTTQEPTQVKNITATLAKKGKAIINYYKELFDKYFQYKSLHLVQMVFHYYYYRLYTLDY